MIIEQLIFTIIALAIFVYMFFRMIKNNDTTYIAILILEALGIFLNFVEVLFGKKINSLLVIIKYVLAILLPIGIIVLEKQDIYLLEIVNLAKAKICLLFGNNKKAKQALLSILEKNPNSYKAHKLLAQIYEKEGGMRRAIDEYVQAVDLNKKDYESYYKVALLLNNLEKREEAAQMLFSLLNKKPDIYEASLLLGEILIDSEKYKEAVNVYQEALKYNQTSFELNYNLGIAYTMLNDFQSAKECYEKAAELNSLYYNAKYSLAEIAMLYKDLDAAEEYFEQTIQDEDLEADSYFELAKIKLMRGEKDLAIKYANIAIDIESKRISEKIKKEPLFIPILAKISIPFNLEEKEEPVKLSKQELIAKEHLENTTDITMNMGYVNLKKKKEKTVEKAVQKERE